MIIDLTLELKEKMPSYADEEGVIVKEEANYEKDGYFLRKILLGEHIGTHVDAPAHFIKGGITIEKIPIENFIGIAYIHNLSYKKCREEITIEDIKLVENSIKITDFYIYYTGISIKYPDKEYFTCYPQLTKDTALYLSERHLRAIGTDAPSPDYYPYEIHKILLSKNILIIESLSNLDKILNRHVKLYALPLKISGGSGSPIRAFAEIF